MLPCCGHGLARKSPRACHAFATVLPCHCHVIAMLLPCYCHVIAMLLPCWPCFCDVTARSWPCSIATLRYFCHAIAMLLPWPWLCCCHALGMLVQEPKEPYERCVVATMLRSHGRARMSTRACRRGRRRRQIFVGTSPPLAHRRSALASFLGATGSAVAFFSGASSSSREHCGPYTPAPREIAIFCSSSTLSERTLAGC